MSAPLPLHEQERLKALERLQILDTEPEQDFDDLTLLASEICETPIALVTLLDERRQWIKSQVGFGEVRETARELAFCEYGLTGQGILTVEDAQLDPRFADNPFVTGGPKIRFYAGARLITGTGYTLGMLCVMDQKPRHLRPEQLRALEVLSRQVMAQMELRRLLGSQREHIVRLEAAETTLIEHARKSELEVEVGMAMTRCEATLPEMLQDCTESMVRVLRVDFARVWTLDSPNGGLELQACAGGWREAASPNDRSLSSRSRIVRVVQQLQPIFSNQGESDFAGGEDWEQKEGIAGFAGYPLIVSDVLVGVVAMYSRQPLSKEVLEALEAIAYNIALGIERKRAEDSLRTSKEHLQYLVRSSPAVIFLLKVAGSKYLLTWIGENVLRFTGYTVEEAMNRTWWAEHVHPADLARATTADASDWPDEHRVLEYRFRHKDGRYRWIRDEKVPVRDRHGVVVEVVGSWVDITERKQATDDFDRLFALSADMMGTVGFDGYFKRVNPAFENILGYTPAEMFDRPLASFVHPEDRERTAQATANWQSGQSSTFFENRCICKDGTERWLQWNVIAEPELKLLFCVTRDVTGQKKADETLRLLESAVGQVGESILITDAEVEGQGPQILFVNAAFTKLTGYQAHEVMGKSPRFLRGPRSDALVIRKMRGALELGESVQGETVSYRKDGSEFDMEWLVGPICDREGKVTHFVATQRDVTERRKGEAELHRVHQQLVLISRQAGMAEVATNVLHNVGNVLNSVNVSCSILNEKLRKLRVPTVARAAGLLQEHSEDLAEFLNLNPDGRKLPDFMQKLAEQMKLEQAVMLGEIELLDKNIKHIKEIVSVQQSYANVAGLKEPLSMAELVEDALRMNALSLKRHEVEVVREFALTPPVMVDKHKVLQILINLVCNAEQAIKAGGADLRRLVIRIEPQEQKWVAVSVIDSGTGIAPENLTRIFAHGFTTKKNGHGFGLHSGVLAAQEMGGRLLVHSEGLGLGSTFTLQLPIEPNRSI